MSLFHSPQISKTNLLLNLDFRNPKVFSSFGTNLVTHPNYDPATWGTAFFGTKTTGIDAPDGSKTAVRLSGTARTGTYTVTSNVATITITTHNVGTGQNHYFDFTSGTAPDGLYTVTVIDANTFTIPITTANTSGNVTVAYRSGQRINITPFTPNGTDTYTFSFWARLISLGTLPGFSTSFSADFSDGLPSITYTSQLVQNKWVHIIASGVPTSTSKGFLDVVSDLTTDFIIDLWGVKLENQTADNTTMVVKDNVGNYSFDIYRTQYSDQEIDFITFDRTTAPTAKWGGLAVTTGTGDLTVNNFMYNDHTWEVWFRINDRTPEGTTNETLSGLANYRGFHSGFQYTATTMTYYIWNSTTSGAPCNWTVGTSGTQIIQGQWYQICVTRSGNTFTPYLNGVQSGSSGTFSTASGPPGGLSSSLHIGGVVISGPGIGNFNYYARNSISNMKMYKRALTSAEVRQNFDALRGRYAL